jgi:hypothetical protein
MLTVAAVPVIVTEALFGPDTSTGGWERLAYVFPFAYGFLIASDARFESALSRARWPALAAAAAATAGLLGWAAAAGPGMVTRAEPGWSALQGLAGWAWVAAIAGFAAAFTARRRQTGTGTPPPAPARQPQWQRAAGYANQAVLPFYLLHEPVIVAFAWIIVRWHAPILVKYPVLVVVSFTATLVIYELAVRQYRITRLLFGMKRKSAPWTDDRFGQARPEGDTALGASRRRLVIDGQHASAAGQHTTHHRPELVERGGRHVREPDGKEHSVESVRRNPGEHVRDLEGRRSNGDLSARRDDHLRRAVDRSDGAGHACASPPYARS